MPGVNGPGVFGGKRSSDSGIPVRAHPARARAAEGVHEIPHAGGAVSETPSMILAARRARSCHSVG